MTTRSSAWSPDVAREEFLNAGVILFCRTHRFLRAAIELDTERLRALAPEVNQAAVAEQLSLIPRLCAGEGPIGELGQAEVFHWVTAPHSTVIQSSPVHSGETDDLPGAVETLMATLVRRAEKPLLGVVAALCAATTPKS